MRIWRPSARRRPVDGGVDDVAHDPVHLTRERMAPSTAVAAPGRTREAVRGATPLALAGLVALVVARALPTRAYGALAQLLAVFFVVSMPGNALLVGVVRRVTAWRRADRADRV